ncbi:MAG: SDR family NAD(P)-dependent oxidoreductase, partial [Oscillospiraceae bacterium]|nr:SDR family NAD(P)-dependent oxidoreductase [Oscillospiraceae bacterium]
MRVLVSGGAGYIGSHTALELLKAGYEVLIADNFSNSRPEVLRRLEMLAGQSIPFKECELCDAKQTEELFESADIDAVIHFAGLKAVGESVEKPLEYYSNNLISTINLLSSMKRRSIKSFVFSSSATVYGSPESVPIKEDLPLSATNPYGRT